MKPILSSTYVEESKKEKKSFQLYYQKLVVPISDAQNNSFKIDQISMIHSTN